MGQHKTRFLVYAFVFFMVGAFDALTTVASYVVELGTGLIDQGSGFPDDYAVALFSLPLVALSLWLYTGRKSKTLDIILSLLFVGYIVFSVIMVFAVLAMRRWTG